MIVTGDTKPEWNSIRLASNGGAGADDTVECAWRSLRGQCDRPPKLYPAEPRSE